MVAATQQRPSVLRTVIAGLAGAVVGLIITFIGSMVALNTRPRQTLNWMTPSDKLAEALR